MTLQARSLKAFMLLSWLAAMLFCASSRATAHTIVNHCGQTLEQPGTYILASDLDCSGTLANGINIAASDVTFHLGPHTLSSSDCDLTKTIYGIFVPGSVTNVRIDGGSVRGFVDGVVLTSSRSQISAMDIVGACQFGVAVQNTGNIVTTSRIRETGVDGIGLQVASGTLLIANDISDNRGNGIGLSNNSNYNFIAYNRFTRNSAAGSVVISWGSRNSIYQNEFDADFDGILLEDKDNLVFNNTITGAIDVGIYLAGSASPSTVERNTVLGSAIADMSDASPGCAKNVWNRNAFQTDRVGGSSDGGPTAGCVR